VSIVSGCSIRTRARSTRRSSCSSR
jgi:hypothetical protein